MNLVTIPYKQSTVDRNGFYYELIAYEIIHPSLQSNALSDANLY